MKITKQKLNQIIKEEMAKILQEVDFARGNIPPRTPGGKFYVDDPANPGAQRGSKNPSRQRVKIFDPKTGTNIFDERVPTRGGRGAAAGNRFRHEMEGLYRRAEKVYKKAARFEKIFGDDAVKIMVASAKQGRKAAIKAMVGSVLGTVAAPVMAVYTAVEIADMLANHYIDTYGGGKRLTLPDDQLNDRERRAKQMLEKEVRSSGKILSPADVAAGRFKGVVQTPDTTDYSTAGLEMYEVYQKNKLMKITKSQLKQIILEEMSNIQLEKKKKDNKKDRSRNFPPTYSEEVDLEEEKGCWDGYTKKGMKPKGGRMVPNCVPLEEEALEEKKKKRKKKTDGKKSGDKGYSLRDWFKGGGWVQVGGKYDGKPCAKQPGQKSKPYCRDADDRKSMSKKERERRVRRKRKQDPNPDRRGKAINVSQKRKKRR